MRRPSQTTQIFIGLAAGIVLGAMWPDAGVAVRPLADIFLRLIKMILAPLIFSTLVVGIAGTGELKAVGRIGLKAIVWFELATTVALAVGLLMVNVVKPGAMLTLQPGGDTATAVAMVKQQQTGWDLVLHLVPTSVVDAMARGDVLQIVVFSTFFGVALAAIGSHGAPLVSLLDTVARVMFKVTGYVMRFAPIGVFGAMAGTIGGHGLSVLASLGALVATLYAALILFVVIVVGGATTLVRVPVLAFLRAAREPFVIAFSTASSEAALPKAIEAMEQFGVPKRIASFVLPTGYSFNLDGSTLYLSAASIFVAQAAGVELSIGQQITMMLTLMVTSKGVAGVPRASLVILAATLSAFHLPLEGIALLLGVDQVLDMARTGVNVLGNCLASVVVARWEGEFDDAAANGLRVAPQR
jgi:proton glutamate symport protein